MAGLADGGEWLQLPLVICSRLVALPGFWTWSSQLDGLLFPTTSQLQSTVFFLEDDFSCLVPPIYGIPCPGHSNGVCPFHGIPSLGTGPCCCCRDCTKPESPCSGRLHGILTAPWSPFRSLTNSLTHTGGTCKVLIYGSYDKFSSTP